jgi:hypothetical protein
MGEWRDHLDEALDEALASYGKGPESEGLARRVLVRITETTRRAHWTRSLVVTIGVATAAITACLFLWVRPRPTVAIHTPSATATMRALSKIETPQERTTLVPQPATVRASAAKPRKLRKEPIEPKLSQFPTPSPLGSEERALVQLVTNRPKESPRDWTYLGSPVKPIQVTEVQIKPIRLGWYTGEKRCCNQ